MNRLIVSKLYTRQWQSIGPCVSSHLNNIRLYSDQSDKTLKTYEEHIQESMLNSAIGGSLIHRIFKSKTYQLHNTLDANLRELLDKSGAKIYYDCANGFPYLTLLKEFDLPDYLSSWYKLTLLHVWLCLLRLHVALDAAAYQRIQQSVLSSLWFDVDNRLEVIGNITHRRLNTKNDMKKMHALYLQTLLEYDEGFLDNDCGLTSAVWRNLYISRAVDPVYLNNVVKYIRATVAYLDTIDSNNLLVSGISKWEPANQLANQV